MHDTTETLRRELVVEVNSEILTREALESKHGQVWDTNELRTDFEVLSFAAPFIMVRRRADGRMGTLTFSHSPRFYFEFVADHP